ncbi:MAG: monothiol glutaredoxin grx4 [Vezdaea aestivalis]|nr:MAG: monothiol glutaredoxin grx4 [Vezdaea aestivalis]
MTTITPLLDPDSLPSLLQSPTLTTLLAFHTPWAAPCTQLLSILSTLAPSYPATSLQILTIDAEQHPDISEAYDVSAVPFLALHRSGKVVETVSGSDAKRVRDAVSRVVGSVGGVQQQAVPEALVAGEPAIQDKPPGASGEVTKDLSSYAAPDPTSPPAPTAAQLEEDKQALHARLTTLTTAAPVMLFMKGTPSAPQCGFSRQLVGELRERGVRYGFFNILADEDVRQGLKEFADWPTFPQLWVAGELVGGLDIVREEWANDPEYLGEYTAAKKTETVEAS